jgi:hypothetical protein
VEQVNRHEMIAIAQFIDHFPDIEIPRREDMETVIFVVAVDEIGASFAANPITALINRYAALSFCQPERCHQSGQPTAHNGYVDAVLHVSSLYEKIFAHWQEMPGPNMNH